MNKIDLGKIFNKGLSEDDQKEGLFKRLKNIENKNEEQLKLLSNTNKNNSYIKNDNSFAFYKFYRDFPNFKDRSPESKFNDISNFYKNLNEFKNHKTNTNETRQRKNKATNNLVKLYNNYFDTYKKTFNEILNETFDENTLDGIKIYDPHHFKIESLLPEWLESKNNFNGVKKLINDIEVDINKVKASKEDKKVFSNLNRLIIHINNSKVKKKDAVERLNKSISDLDQLKQKQNTILRNKMTQVVYQLFNSFGFNKEFAPLFSQIKSDNEELEPLFSQIKSNNKEPTQLKQINLIEIIKPLWIKLPRNDFISLIKDVVNNLDNKNYQTMINVINITLKMQNNFC